MKGTFKFDNFTYRESQRVDLEASLHDRYSANKDTPRYSPSSTMIRNVSKISGKRKCRKVKAGGLTFDRQISRHLDDRRRDDDQIDEKVSTLSSGFLSRHLSEGMIYESQLDTDKRREGGEVDLAKRKEATHTIDFSKTLPRECMKPIKVSKSKAYQAYVVNFNSVDKKSDKMCIPFDKSMGRQDIRSAAARRTTDLGRKLDLLTKIKREDTKIDSKMTKRHIQTDTAMTERSVNSRIGGKLVPLDKSMPRSRDPNNVLPSWMQKEASYNRLGLKIMGEKSIEFNSFKTGKMRSYRENTYWSKPRVNKKYNIDQNNQSSDEELYDLPSIDN